MYINFRTFQTYFRPFQIPLSKTCWVTLQPVCLCTFFFRFLHSLLHKLHMCIGAKIFQVLRKGNHGPLLCCLLKLPFLNQPFGTVARPPNSTSGSNKTKERRRKSGSSFLFKLNHYTVFENHRKSIIQHCERSEIRLHFEWTKVN